MMKLNARTKIIMVIGLSVFAVMSSHVPYLLGGFLLSAILYGFGSHRKHWKSGSWKGFIFLLFSLVLIQILFRRGGDVWFTIGSFEVYRDSVKFALASALRLMIIVFSAGFLLNVSYYEYILAFQAWHIPYEISFMVGSVLYFLPILQKRVKQTQESMAIRAIYWKQLSLLERLIAFGTMAMSVLGSVMASLRFRVISLEMKAFRYHPQRTHLRSDRLNLLDYLLQYCVLLLFLAVILVKAYHQIHLHPEWW